MNQKFTTLGHIPLDTRPGDIIACRSHGWSPLSWAIRKRTGSQINHVADCIGTNQMVEALGSVVHTSVERLRNQWWVHLRPSYIITPEQAANFVQWQLEQVGKKYDWSAIFGFGPWSNLNGDNGNPSKWFCSEKTYESHRIHFGKKLVARKPDGRVSPGDIFMSTELPVIGYQWPESLKDWLEE